MKFLKPRTEDKKRWTLRRIMMGCTAAAMAALTLAQGLTAQAPATALAASVRQGRTVMYVYDSANLGLRAEDADRIDQINYAFALIENGKATGSHWRGIRELTAYLRQHPSVDGVLSVGGWGADGFSQACATEEGRGQLADSILALMDVHGFTGVDIDWEYPGSSTAGIASSEDDIENWYALLALLRTGLDQRTAATGRKHSLSVALGVNQASEIDPSRLNSVLDQVVLMAYDLRGSDKVTGHHAGLYPDGTEPASGAYGVKALISGGMAKGKILLGIPAYGRMWRQVSGAEDGLGVKAGTSGNRTLSYADVQRLEQEGYTRYYDNEAQAAWWYNGSNFVSAEDEQSLRCKTRWVLDQGLLGTAVWSYASDTDGTVTRILSEGLSR